MVFLRYFYLEELGIVKGISEVHKQTYSNYRYPLTLAVPYPLGPNVIYIVTWPLGKFSDWAVYFSFCHSNQMGKISCHFYRYFSSVCVKIVSCSWRYLLSASRSYRIITSSSELNPLIYRFIIIVRLAIDVYIFFGFVFFHSAKSINSDIHTSGVEGGIPPTRTLYSNSGNLRCQTTWTSRCSHWSENILQLV